MVRPRDLPLRLEPALALGLPARGAARRRVPVAAAADTPRDLGLPGHAHGRDDARDARGGEGPPARPARRRPDRPLVKDVTVLVSRLGRARNRCAPEGPARERRADGPARRHRHERALGRPPPLRCVPPRAGRLRPGLRGRRARHRRARGRRRRPAAVVVRPRRARRAPRPLPGAGARLLAGHDPPLERQGGDLCAAAAARRQGTRLPARQRRRRGRRRGRGARLPGPARLLQARLLLRLARVPDPRPHRRPGAPAAERAAGIRGDAARGSGRAPARTRAAPTCS